MEGCDNDEEQRRFLEQIVIDKDLPVSMRTIQVRTETSSPPSALVIILLCCREQ